MGELEADPEPAKEQAKTKPVWPLRRETDGEALGWGIPSQFTRRRSWQMAGLRLQPWGAATGLIVSWTGLLAALWAAAFGMVLSVLVATRAVSATRFTASLFHLHNTSSVGVVHVVTAALAGGGGAFVATAARLVDGGVGALGA